MGGHHKEMADSDKSGPHELCLTGTRVHPISFAQKIVTQLSCEAFRRGREGEKQLRHTGDSDHREGPQFIGARIGHCY